MLTDNEPQPEKKLPYNPIDSAMRTPEHARRTIQGILESYNGNYDILAEAVQNSMDALEDAFLQELPGPYLLQISVNLKDNTIAVFDTGIGMNKEQICEAFAPSASFKDGLAILKKRGDKFPYRGYKGVGLTFLAYGTDDVQIQSRQNGTVTKGRMRFGRKWVEGKIPEPPLLDIDTEQTALDRQKRGTYIRLQFSSDTKPPSLSQLGSTIEIWEVIVRVRTAVGQIFIGQDPLAPIKVRLMLVGKDGLEAEKDISPGFYYPHLVKRNPPLRFMDVGKYHQEHPGIADHSEDAKRQDAVYIQWDTSQLRDHLEDKDKAEFDEELTKFSPCLYAFRPYHQPLWSVINESATGQVRTHYFAPGLVIGVNHQRMAESTRIVASRSDLLAQNVFVLVHFDKAKPDQGRKALQSRLMDLAQIAADDAIQYLLKQGGLLKPAGEKTTSAQRKVEKDHDDWVDNVKANAKENPLSIPPVCYASTPITEQDVVGLFNQFAALGLFPGLKILATSAAHTYDCYVIFDCRDRVERLRYTDDNPLGLSQDIFGVDDTHFSTRGLTVEFKNNLEGLIDNLESPSSKKAFSHIDICICWGSIDTDHRWYTLDPVTEANLHERHYPGVTHVLRRDSHTHIIQIVMLEEIVKKVSTGQIRWEAKQRR
jgi:hypothetical protein